MKPTFIVVPFVRSGQSIGTRQFFVFDALEQARFVAHQIAQQFPGVAIIERSFDEATGDDTDRLVGAHGAVPPQFPETRGWCTRLH